VITQNLSTVFHYFRYLFSAVSPYRVHSPFVYKLYTDVIRSKEIIEVYASIEAKRSELLKQKSVLETTDFGSGSGKRVYKTRYRRISDIARHSSISPKYGRLLHRLVRYASPETILEIGTAFGISSLYMATAAPGSRMITLEGCANTADKAMENFTRFGLENIELVIGNFDHWLERSLEDIEKLDFVLLDGNHRKEPTLEYFRLLLPKLHHGSIVVIDDIHRPDEMRKAWRELRLQSQVTVSIDLHRAGILMFNEDIERQAFTLRF
jgi:predicted O-methyltransferase YrrM